MHSKTFPRYLVGAWRLLLCVFLVAALGPVARVRSAPPGGGFTDLGALGLPAAEYASVAWGDYDGDGDLDVLLEGYTGSGSVAGVYRNDGGTFTDVAAGLPAVSNSEAAWGDYDNDGDLDVLLGSGPATYVFRNDGGAFVDIGAGLAGAARGGVAWGDYDLDGDLDILLAGWNSSTVAPVTKIYRNDGGTFTDANAGIPAADDSDVAWGDYDNDGDLDVLLVGYVEGAGTIARIYRNDAGTFVDANAGLAGVSYGSAAWGDYDNDGDLDILLTGSYEARVYRNDGGAFVDIDAGLTGVYLADAAWGDYDNDGDLDIALSGRADRKNLTLVYSNDGGDTFSDSRSRLTGAYNSDVAWGDYDNDGDLDLLLAGNAGGVRTTVIYRNDSRTANTPPSAPPGPSATVDGFGVDLSWGAAGDGQTPSSGLSYNLRLGTSPGGVDVASPMADLSSGWRRLPQLGNLGQGTGAHFELPFGTYYWGAQAVDTAFAGGAFSGEGSFAIEPVAPGQVTIAGPSTVEVDSACVFTATVAPETTELPLTYLWEADGQQPVSHEGVSSLNDTVSFTWSTLGARVVTVTVSNSLGSLSATHSVTVEPPPPFTDLGSLGLPGVERGVVVWGDYDNDGDLDLLQTGVTPSGAKIARVYRNDGGTFVNAGAGLPGVTDGAAAWGDYDNDGDLDIALTGNTGSGRTARIYRNDGGSFTDIDAGLTGVALPGLAWGDYDNDGDLDLLVTGGDDNGFSMVIKLYRNDGGGSFTEVSTGLPAISYCSVAWGDYDNDGDLDLLMAGHPASTRIYRNDGGTFVDINAGLPGVLWAAVAWGDYDADGDLDLALLGKLDPYQPTRIARIYRNDGGDTFTDVNAGLPPASAGSVDWGDYDNDGDLDLLLTCGQGSRLFRNDGNDTFTSVGAGLPPAVYADAAWGDYDNDGDLDIAVVGYDGSQRIARVYRNNSLSANTPPGAPSGPAAALLTDTVALSWDAAADAETPAAGLTYNLRVGTTPGGMDAVTPMADVGSGWRRVAALGNANHGTTAWLELPPGTYYWSVQAVDAALAGSAFGPEASFLVPQPPEGVSIAGPLGGKVDTAHAFTATVTPLGTALPLTYTWEATGQAPVSHEGVVTVTDSVTYTWPLTGSKSITVTVANERGQVTATHAITLSQLAADFSATPLSGIAPVTATFTNLTSGPYSYSDWDFGDGITSTLESPTHTYTIPGVYTVTLTASGDAGSDTMTKPGYITVYEPVQADFTGEPVVGPAPLTVVFTNTTTGDYADSEWGFGDGITSTLEGPTHTYTLPGVYTVTLTASGLGGTDIITKADYITAATPVQANFTAVPSKGVVPLTVELTNTSTGDYSESLWDLGDAITSTLASLTHTYTVGGLYTVSLTVSGTGGIDTRVVTDCITAYPVTPDPGPHRTGIVVQNVGSRAASVKLNLVTGETGGEPQRYDLGSRLQPKGWRRVASGDLQPGLSGVWAGSGTLLSTQPLAAVVDMLWDDPLGPKTGAAYTSQGAPANEAYLPRVATADGYLTQIVVHNTGAAEAAVAIHIYDRAGAEALVHNASIPAGAEKTFSLADLAPDLSASNGWGSAYVSADQPVAALATVHTLFSSAVYAGAAAGDTTLWAPGVRRGLAGPDYSEVAVQNTATVSASVHVEFIGLGGTLAHDLYDTIAPQATAAYNTYTRGTLDVATWQDLIAALGDNWRGTVRITSTGGQPLVGVGTHWAESMGLGDGLAVGAVGAGAASGNGLTFPAVHRLLTGGSDERWSVACVHNTAAVSGTLSVEFYDADGALVGSTYQVEVAAGGSLRLDLKDGADLPPAALTALGEGFSGSLVVTPSTGLQIVGLSQTWWPGEERAWGYAGLALP